MNDVDKVPNDYCSTLRQLVLSHQVHLAALIPETTTVYIRIPTLHCHSIIATILKYVIAQVYNINTVLHT